MDLQHRNAGNGLKISPAAETRMTDISGRREVDYGVADTSKYDALHCAMAC